MDRNTWAAFTGNVTSVAAIPTTRGNILATKIWCKVLTFQQVLTRFYSVQTTVKSHTNSMQNSLGCIHERYN